MPQEFTRAEEQQAYFHEETGFLNNVLNSMTESPIEVSIEQLQDIARIRLSLSMASEMITNLPSGETEILNI